ncbi:hypothetical protein JZX86_26635 [Agrobacterium rosae]|nr:hypothetical protein [Agrobacterium rosae]
MTTKTENLSFGAGVVRSVVNQQACKGTGVLPQMEFCCRMKILKSVAPPRSSVAREIRWTTHFGGENGNVEKMLIVVWRFGPWITACKR